MLVAVDVIQLITPRIIQKAIDFISNPRGDYSYLLHLALLIFLLAFAIGILRFLWRMIIIGMAHYIEMDFKNHLYQHLLILSSSFFNRIKTGDIMAHMTNDMKAVKRATAFGIIAGFDSVFLFLATLIFMMTLNVKLTIYALLPLPFISGIALFFIKNLFTKFREVQESFSRMTEKVRELISGIKIIQAFQQEDKETDNFDTLSHDYVEKNISLIKLWGIMFPLIFLFAEIGIAIILWVGGRQVVLNELSTGELVAFFTYLGIIVWPMMAVGIVTNVFQRGNASLKRIYSLLEEEPEISDTPVAIAREIKGDIELKEISFSFDEKKKVVDHLNMHFRVGEYVGICGKIGSGKSMIAKLILREIHPDEGIILYDGIEHSKIKISSVRDSIGYVPQDSFLFSDTISENIRFGKEDATKDEINEVCRIASIHKDIMQLKKNYETVIGERGVTLSGGQRQRICIARAIIRKPRILILDDALSAVDTNTEKEIIKNLSGYIKGITTIVISHRISSFIKSDKIYVLDEGRLESEGIHSELIKKSRIYKNIYQIQKLED